MAELSAGDRLKVSTGLQRYFSNNLTALSMTKADWIAAVNATDTWIDTNQSSFNTALPANAQANLSLAQKTLLFCVVAAFRVSQEFAERLVGRTN